jgi:hypothetical protein
MIPRISGERLSGQHHGHIDPTGKLRQPLGVTGVGKSCEMQRVLVGRSGDDRIDLTAECQAGHYFDGVPGYAARTNDPVSVVVALAAAEVPSAHRDSALGWDGTDLIFGPDDEDLRIDRLGQGGGGDFGADPARITQGNSESRT